MDINKYNYEKRCEDCKYWDGCNLIGECKLIKSDTMKFNSCDKFKERDKE